MNNSYITIIKEKRTDLSRKRIPLNQNKCTADFRMSVPFEQNLQDWKKVTIDNIKCTKGDVKIGVYVDHAADGWGTIDDFYFGQK